MSDTSDQTAWKEMLIAGLGVCGVVALLGHFISSCEISKHRMVTECLRAGRSAAECKLMEKP